MQLRPYQSKVIDDLWAWFHKHDSGNPIVNAVVGAGKSVLIAALALSNELAAVGAAVFAVIGAPGPDEEDLEALRAKAKAPFDLTLRLARHPRLSDAHEQLVLGEVSTWYGIFAPKGTPQAIVDRMIKEVRTALQVPSIKEAWERNGSDVPDVTGPAFAKMLSSEVERWRKVVTDANVKLD